MAAAGSQVPVLADELERYICDALAISRPTAVLRRMKINQMTNNANSNSGEIEYSQACSYFAENAANPQALEATLMKLQARGDTSHKQFLAMLHVLLTDQELEPLRRAQAAAANRVPAAAATATAVLGRATAAAKQQGLPTAASTAAPPTGVGGQAGGQAGATLGQRKPAAVGAAGLAAAGTQALAGATAAGPAAAGAGVRRPSPSTAAGVDAAAARRPAVDVRPGAAGAGGGTAPSPTGVSPKGVSPSAAGAAAAGVVGGAAGAAAGAGLARRPVPGQPPAGSVGSGAAGTAGGLGAGATGAVGAAGAAGTAPQDQAAGGAAGARAGASGTGVAGRGTGEAGAADRPFFYGKNPVYGQEDAYSPLPHAHRDYTPSLTESMAAARHAGSGNRQQRLQELRPALPAAAEGDLFIPGPGTLSPGGAHVAASGGAHAGAPWAGAAAGGAWAAGTPMTPQADRSWSRPRALQPPAGVGLGVGGVLTAHQQQQQWLAWQQLQPELMDLLQRLPAWASERPYLTGQALVLQAAAEAPAPTPGTAGGVGDDAAAAAARDALSMLPPSLQELAVLHDLLYVFLGHSGTYIRARLVQPQSNPVAGGGAGSSGGASGAGGGPITPAAGALGGGQAHGKPTLTFHVDAELEPCLLEMVQRVLPICEYVVVLQRFIETRSGYQYPLVFHAVAAVMRSLLADWTLLVTQLEHQLRLGQLNLQALTFHCQAPMASLKLLASIAAEAASRRLTSAGLLNLLHARSCALVGDQQGRALAQRLLTAGCQPYFQILDKWLWEGVLDDPHSEFMVQEDKSVGKNDLTPDRQLAYWYHRHTLRTAPPPEPQSADSGSAAGQGEGGAAPSSAQKPAGGPALDLDVPVFLKAHAEMILTTGKYLNVIRECGQHAPKPPPPPAWAPGTGGSAAPTNRVQFDPHGAFAQQIAAAHAHASASLLQLLVVERQLMTLLRSLKHYFLLDQGDVLVHLIETAQEELSKPTRVFSTTRLQSLLELAVKTSSAASDPMSDNLAFEMDPRSVMELARAATRTAGRGIGGPGSALRGADSAMTPGGMSVGTPASVTSNVRKVLARQQSGRKEQQGQGPAASSGTARDKGKDKEDKPAWDFFLLSYRVAWPHTLVVSPSQLSHYQLIFKLLLVLKLTERQLSLTWHRVAEAVRARDKALVSARIRSRTNPGVAGGPAGQAGQVVVPVLPWDESELQLVYSLGQRFTFFVQELLRYATFDVLEPLWGRMEAAIRKATNVDQVVQLHRSFLSRALAGLLLSQPRILRLVWSISHLAGAYCRAVSAALSTPAHTSSQPPSRQSSAALGTAGAAAGTAGPGASAAAAAAAAAAKVAGLGSASGAGAGDEGLAGADTMAGVSSIFSANLSTLVLELQQLYEVLMRREGAGAEAVESMQAEELADSRDELGRLQSLIERISCAQAPLRGRRGLAPVSLAALSMHTKG